MSKFKLTCFSIIAAGILLSMSSVTVSAQHYNQAHVDSLVAIARAKGPCRDPWITIAIWDKVGSTRDPNGIGDFNECSPALYNGGSWSSYAELYRAVDQTLSSLSSAGITFKMSSPVNGTVKLETDVNGVSIGSGTVRIISHDAGSLLTSDGAGLLSHDGGGFVVVGGYFIKSIGDACKKIPISGGRYFVVRKCR
jgi:hypothetical protein